MNLTNRVVDTKNINPEKPIVVKDDLLASKYKDRWEVLKLLMGQLPTLETLPQCTLKEGEKQPAVKFSWQAPPDKHPYLNVGFDTHIIDPTDSIMAVETFNHEYTLRKKIYISEKNIMQYRDYIDQGNTPNKEAEYFFELKKDFDKVMKYYYDNMFDGISEKYQFWTSLMLVEYACPFANSDNAIEQRSKNTLIWGPYHCDETIAGIHLGEDVREFQASYNGEHGEYIYIPELVDNHSLFFFGENSQEFGYTPTYHQMIPHPSEPNSTRYSIIMDLVPREIESN